MPTDDRADGSAALAVVLAQGLCTRLCHDLAGPLGAVGSGTELLGEEGGADPQILGLLTDSAENATARLRFLRAILGAPVGRGLEPGSARTLLADYLRARAGAKAPTLEWHVRLDADAALQRRRVQVVLNFCLVVLDALPRCERLSVTESGTEAGADSGGGQIEIVAAGAGTVRPALLEGLDAGLRGEPAVGVAVGEDPVSVQATYAGLLATGLGLTVRVETTPGALHVLLLMAD